MNRKQELAYKQMKAAFDAHLGHTMSSRANGGFKGVLKKVTIDEFIPAVLLWFENLNGPFLVKRYGDELWHECSCGSTGKK